MFWSTLGSSKSVMFQKHSSLLRPVVAMTGCAGLSCAAHTPEACPEKEWMSLSVGLASSATVSTCACACRMASMSESATAFLTEMSSSSQTLISPSREQETRSLSWLMTLTKRTSPLWPEMTRMRDPFTRSQMLTALSRAPEKSPPPLSENPMDVTSPRWPSKLCLSAMRTDESSRLLDRIVGWSERASHTLICESRPVEARSCVASWYATTRTELLWSSFSSRRANLLVASQILKLESLEPETRDVSPAAQHKHST
mmetsp:Transcript_3799/g.9592  ORF Transcript_3799/g.9592 Transcript_3799/m.9592 type:complete len:257 (+) Transcript_3799:195-965(+)